MEVNISSGALIASSYKSFEIVVVDDASTDDSAEISGKSGVTVLLLPDKSSPSAQVINPFHALYATRNSSNVSCATYCYDGVF